MTGTEFEGKEKDKNEIERLAEEGKIYSFKGSDLYEEYYNLADDEDLRCCFRYGYSARSRRYIESVMKEIGFTSYKYEDYYTNAETVATYQLYLNATTDIDKCGSEWIAQTAIYYEDNFNVIKMYFDHIPSEKEVKAAFDIIYFGEHPKEVFKCSVCGKLSHWLSLKKLHLKKIGFATYAVN